jgi:hypothetical protein
MKDYLKSIAFISLPVLACALVFNATIMRAYTDAKKMKDAPYTVSHVVREPAVVVMYKR